MSGWPNHDPKPSGCYVEAVHPLTAGGPDDETVTVAIGRGSTVYGPARHWRPITRRPAWLEVQA